MPRNARIAPGGMVFHVLNRGVGRMTLFETSSDYDAFERVLQDTLAEQAMRVCAYCLMTNHWHMLLWPEHDGDLAAFMQRLTITHVRRWLEFRDEVGSGHVYQDRFKSFPVQSDWHFLTVARYVERNAMRANVVHHADDWRWSSLHRRMHRQVSDTRILSDWPVDAPSPTRWTELVNEREPEASLESLRCSVRRGKPFGSDDWCESTIARLKLESTVRRRGRPARKQSKTREGKRGQVQFPF